MKSTIADRNDIIRGYNHDIGIALKEIKAIQANAKNEKRILSADEVLQIKTLSQKMAEYQGEIDRHALIIKVTGTPKVLEVRPL